MDEAPGGRASSGHLWTQRGLRRALPPGKLEPRQGLGRRASRDPHPARYAALHRGARRDPERSAARSLPRQGALGAFREHDRGQPTSRSSSSARTCRCRATGRWSPRSTPFLGIFPRKLAQVFTLGGGSPRVPLEWTPMSRQKTPGFRLFLDRVTRLRRRVLGCRCSPVPRSSC